MLAASRKQAPSLCGAVGGAFSIREPIEQRIEVFQSRVDFRRLIDRTGDRLDRLVAVTCYRHDHRLVRFDAPLLDQLERDRERGAAGRLRKNSLGACEQLDRVDNFRVGRDLAPSAGIAHRLQHVKAVGRISNRDRLRNRVGLHRRYQVGMLVQRVNDRGGAGGLRRMNLELAALDEPDFLHLLKRLGDFRQNRSARGRHYNVIWQAPAKLLRHFEAEGLRALGVERPQVDIDEGPAVLVRDFAAQAVHVVVVAANRDNARAVNRRADDFSRLHAFGHEDVALQPRARRVRRDRGRKVAGRSAGHGGEAELARLGDRNRHDAVLVRQRRMIDGVVLYIEMLKPEFGAQPLAMYQRREAGVRADFRLGLEIDRQQFAIAPQVVRPLLDYRARDRRANPRVVVSDFERTKAGLAHVKRTYRILLAALATFQIGDVAHRSPRFLFFTASRRHGLLAQRLRFAMLALRLPRTASASRARTYGSNTHPARAGRVVCENFS